MFGSRRGRGNPDPLYKSQKYRFLSNIGPDPFTNHKATKPAFNVGPLSARQRIAIEMAFRWQVDDGPLLVLFGSSSPSKKEEKKRCQSWTPLAKFFWIRACTQISVFMCCLVVLSLSNSILGQAAKFLTRLQCTCTAWSVFSAVATFACDSQNLKFTSFCVDVLITVFFIPLIHTGPESQELTNSWLRG